MLKRKIRNIISKRKIKENEKTEAEIFKKIEINNTVNTARNKQKKNLNYNANFSRKAVPNRDGFSWLKWYFFKNKSNSKQGNAINIANNEKNEKREVNFAQNVDRNSLKQQFIRQKAPRKC